MSKSAFVLGASGQVGRPVINSLLSDGWHVRAGSRTTYEWPVDVEGVLVDREVDSSVGEALAGGADVLIDCVAYSDTHARQVLALEGLTGVNVDRERAHEAENAVRNEQAECCDYEHIGVGKSEQQPLSPDRTLTTCTEGEEPVAEPGDNSSHRYRHDFRGDGLRFSGPSSSML